MDDNILLEKIKQAQNDTEKLEMIRLIQGEKEKVEAIFLLEENINKLSVTKTLKDSKKRAEIYKILIQEDELVDSIIEDVRNFENLNWAISVLGKIPDHNYRKKINTYATMLFEASDYESREKLSAVLKRSFVKIRKQNSDYTFLDFLQDLDNDYTIASAITNVANHPDDELVFNSQFAFLPTTMEDKKDLLVAIKDDKIREQVALLYSSREELIGKLDTNNVSLIGLPEDMTIGVELEAEGKTASVLNNLMIFGTWQTKGDDSLERGIEVTSPILHDSLEDMTDLSRICQIMKKFSLTTSDRCGGHIHIGANYLDTKEALGNFLVLWLANEESIYKMCNPSGCNFREGTVKYAGPISPLYENGSENIFNDISNAQSRDELVRIIQRFKGGHGNGLNLDNINNKKKNTIEFRASNGLLDFEEIQNNIRLYGRLMQRSKEVSLLQTKLKSGQELSEAEQQRISDFEKLTGQQCETREKWQLLIDFLFEEDEREVYTLRYNSFRENAEPLKKLFNKESYKKLYAALHPKNKNFSDIVSSLKENETEDERIE